MHPRSAVKDKLKEQKRCEQCELRDLAISCHGVDAHGVAARPGRNVKMCQKAPGLE